ncbi:hypothetical protein [Natrinema sp. 74]|uniref:hypothetical protein n=1 Tax=Natrinema sp. 74 TaxID=3384159 RepID=UPI0038D4E171
MHVSHSVTAAGFWLGTLFPVAYLPVIAGGIDSASRLSLFIGLLLFHAFALVVGHDYPGARSR